MKFLWGCNAAHAVTTGAMTKSISCVRDMIFLDLTSPWWMQIVRMFGMLFLDACIKSLSRGNCVLNVKNVTKTFSEGYATHRCKEGKVKQMHLRKIILFGGSKYLILQFQVLLFLLKQLLHRMFAVQLKYLNTLLHCSNIFSSRPRF